MYFFQMINEKVWLGPVKLQGAEINWVWVSANRENRERFQDVM